VPYKATLNPFPLTFTDPPERCRNYPPLDLHIGGYSRNESELNSERHANLGDEFYALIYIDNGAADNGPLSQTLAKNIQVKTVVDSGPGTRHTVSVSFAGDNTNTVSKSLIVRTPSNSILEVVPNSGQVLNFQNVLLKTNVEIGNNTFSVGDIGPGFDKDLFLRFKIRIKSIDNANTPDQEQSRVSPYLNKGLGRNCPNPPVKATLNPFPTTYVSPAEFCKNYPAVDVRFATESGRYSQNEEDWKDGIKVKVGDELYVLVYIDNGAANSLPLSETLARNVKVTTIIDTTTGSKHLVSVSFAGENTNTVSASFPIYSQQDSLLEIIPNSGEIRDFLATTILKDKLQIGNNTIDVGDIAPGFQTDLFIRFKVRVVRKYH